MRNIKNTVRNYFERNGLVIASSLLVMNGNTSEAVTLIENR